MNVHTSKLLKQVKKKKKTVKKGGHYEEHGRLNSHGQRNDLYNVVDTLLNNQDDPIGAVAESHPVAFIKFRRGIRDLATTLKLGAKRNYRTKLCIVYGYPGTGKSFGVRQICDKLFGEDLTFYKTRGEWWDGYCNHKAVIIDDFYGWLKYDELLKIADRYPYKVPIKGSFANFLAEWIFITSNSTTVFGFMCWHACKKKIYTNLGCNTYATRTAFRLFYVLWTIVEKFQDNIRQAGVNYCYYQN